MIEPGDFGPFDGRTWLNCAHQGPLPRVAVEAAERAVALKVAPSRLSEEEFARVPRDLRGTLGRLLGVPAHEVVLGNSTTHGLHLLARGLPLRAGDEVLDSVLHLDAFVKMFVSASRINMMLSML